MTEMILHRWEFDPLQSVYRCVPMSLGGVKSDRCEGCGRIVTMEALYQFTGGCEIITSASLNFLVLVSDAFTKAAVH